jgi:hypothetical protein
LLGTFICGFSYAMMAFDYSMITLLDFHDVSLYRRNLDFTFYVNHYSVEIRKNNKGAYMGLNGISFSMAFIITPIWEL